MSNEAGRVRSKRIPALKDASCVAQVRAAGAIPILVSNTPELCMCWETFNYVTGTTKNPYDTRRTCGGSSGGEVYKNNHHLKLIIFILFCRMIKFFKFSGCSNLVGCIIARYWIRYSWIVETSTNVYRYIWT